MRKQAKKIEIGSIEQRARDVRLIARPIALEVVARIEKEVGNLALRQQVLDELIEVLGLAWLGGNMKKVAPALNDKRQKPMPKHKSDVDIAEANRAYIETLQPKPASHISPSAREELARWFDWEQVAENRVKPINGWRQAKVHPVRRKRGAWRKDMRKAMKGD